MRLRACHGRLRLELDAFRQGGDVLVRLSGGAAHVGAVALAAPDSPPRVLTRPGHREDAVALEIAERFSAAFQCAVCVCAGIHFEAITREEIHAVERMCRQLAERCLARHAARRHEEHAC